MSYVLEREPVHVGGTACGSSTAVSTAVAQAVTSAIADALAAVGPSG